MEIRTRPAEWGVLIYSSATPNIKNMALASLSEVARARHDDSVVIGAQLGLPGGGVERFRFVPGREDELEKPERPPRADMSDPATLEDFLRWGVRNFPARRYLVVLGGHSAGFVGAITDSAQSRLMPLSSLAGALQRSGLHPDVLAFNSCLMAQMETAMELYPRADYLVASEGEERAEGMPLGALIESLAGAGSSREAARLLVQSCADRPDRVPTMSALEMNRIPGLAGRLDVLATEILAAPEAAPRLKQAIESAPGFWTRGRPLSDYRDLGTVLGAWARDERLSDGLRQAAEQALRTAQAVVTEHHSGRPETGISLYLPTSPLSPGLAERVEPIYDQLELSRRTAWDQAVRLLSAVPSPC